MTDIEDVELGALAKFGGLQKKVERGEWLTSTLRWVDLPAPKEEGRRKSDGYGIGARPSGRGGGRYMVFNNRVDPQLWIIKRLGEMTVAARLEKIRCPLALDGEEICLSFQSKGDCVRSCTRSHETLRGQSRENILRYISINGFTLNPSKKRKFNGGGDQGYYRGHW